MQSITDNLKTIFSHSETSAELHDAFKNVLYVMNHCEVDNVAEIWLERTSILLASIIERHNTNM